MAALGVPLVLPEDRLHTDPDGRSLAATAGFVGRRRDMALLDGMLAEVRGLAGSARPGRCVIVRRGRRIGKSARAYLGLRPRFPVGAAISCAVARRR